VTTDRRELASRAARVLNGRRRSLHPFRARDKTVERGLLPSTFRPRGRSKRVFRLSSPVIR
jgi:hypothetical protein